MNYVRLALIATLTLLLSLAGFVMPAAAHTTTFQKPDQGKTRPAHEWWKTHRVKYTQSNGSVAYGDCTTESEAEKRAKDFNDYQDVFVPPGQRANASKVNCPHKRG